MAKFIYNKYNTNRNYPSTEPTWELSKRDYGHYTRQEMEYGNTYYPSYTWSAEEGFKVAGTGIYKAAGENPVVGYYYLSKASSYSKKDTLYLILDSTYYDYSSLKTHHYVNTKTAPLTVTKAELVDTISAEEGIYPNDGVYTDWFWYVKTSLNETVTVTTPNGNETINVMHLITFTKSAEDINVDIELSQDNGQIWKRIASSVSETSYEYDFTNESESSQCLIRVRATKDGFAIGWDTSDGVFTINHNAAPLMPTNLQPSNGKLINVNEINRLSWQHNDSGYQSAFNLKWSGDQVTWNEVNRVTPNQYWDALPETFLLGAIYWQVQTYDDKDLESPWSEVATFQTAEPSGAPEITSNPLINVPRPTFTWTQPDQTGYRIAIYDMETEDIVWSSQRTSKNKSTTCGVDLVSGKTYLLGLLTVDSLGEESDVAVQEIYVNYNAPAKPTIILLTDNIRGSITVSITNPEREGLQPEVAYCDIYRDGERIATNIRGSYEDCAVESDKYYYYHVAAVGVNEVPAYSVGTNARVEVKHTQIALTTDYSKWVELKWNPQKSINLQHISVSNYFAGRKFSVAEYGENEASNIPNSFAIREKSELDKLIEIYNAKQTVLYRDRRGRRLFGTINSLNIVDESPRTWWTVSFTLQQVDFNEVV